MWGFLVSGKIPKTSLPAVLFVGWNKYLQLVLPAFILPRRLSKQLDLSVKCFGNLEQITDYDYAKAETSLASEVFFLSVSPSLSLSFCSNLFTWAAAFQNSEVACKSSP